MSTRTGPLLCVPLHEVAHGRAGDKGNRLNVSVIPYKAEAYGYLAKQLPASRVHDLFRYKGATDVRRYDMPTLECFNFVIDNVLEGGVNSSLNLDGHGKTLSFKLLSLTVEVPRSLLHEASPYRKDDPPG